MDQSVIQEARRLLKMLVNTGSMILNSGEIITPKPDIFVSIVEKVASKKSEEVEKPDELTGFEPAGTHHTAPKPLPLTANSDDPSPAADMDLPNDSQAPSV